MRAFLLAFFVSGCFMVTDVDRFEVGTETMEPDDPTMPSTLMVTMMGMGVHLDQLIELRVVDGENFVQSRAVVDPVDKPATDVMTFTLPNAIPADNGPYRLDLYADTNGSHGYDGIPGPITSDHAWRVDPLADYPAGKWVHSTNVVKVQFQHNTQFVDIDRTPDGVAEASRGTGADARIRFRGDLMAGFEGRLVQVRVVLGHQPFHTVGLYRNPKSPAADFEGYLAGIVELGESYDLEVYVDANGNGTYDAPSGGGDAGWRYRRQAQLIEGSSVGIDMEVDLDSATGTIDVGPP